MKDLADQRCYFHQRREAVVRCPECGKYFCRECVTEHHDRMLCAQCLKQLTGDRKLRSGLWVRGIMTVTQACSGFLLLWYLFYLLGIILLSIPHTFHEGTIWESSWWGDQ